MGYYYKELKALYHQYEEIISYLIVGGLTTLVSLVSKYALLFTILDAADAVQLQISVIISWILAVAFAYWANRTFVFKSKDPKILGEIARFVAARVATLLMEALILWFFITLLEMNSDFHVVLWTVVTQILILIGNYVFSKIVVFRKPK
ncbi:GtrA family protein [Candidatus Saccharibacteria bacterium]|nr:GtrA family protein [Candidatus Saccharibacteria bacterium]